MVMCMTAENREEQKNEGKIKKYGIWREKTARHGWCWCYKIRILEADGVLRMRQASGFATKAEAEAAVARLRLDGRARQHGIEIVKPLPATAIGQAVDAYCKALEAKWRSRHGERYARRYKGQISTLKAWAEFAGRDRAVRSITRDDFTYYVQHEAGRGLKPSSIARHINAIRAALYHATETRPDLTGFSLPRRPQLRDADKGRMRILSSDEIKALSVALAAREDWRDALDVFRVGLGSGGRLDEIVPVVERADRNAAGIRWIDVDEEHGTVLLRAGKTGKDRVIVAPEVVAVIMRRRRDGLGDETHTFNRRDHWIRAVFREASEQCEIVYGQRRAGGWTVHDLRHTCLTNLLAEGADIATVRDWAGHSSLSETTKYVHATAKSRQIAARASSALVGLTWNAQRIPNSGNAKGAR